MFQETRDIYVQLVLISLSHTLLAHILANQTKLSCSQEGKT